MSDETHTPGPWKVGYQAMDVMATDAKGDFKVCDIRGWGHLTGKGHGALGLSQDEAVAIQTANANLIAAAPDLLAACKDCLEGQGDWVSMMSAAVAKAEGAS